MNQIGRLELVGLEAADLNAPIPDMTPDLLTMRCSAAELARNLAWVPAQRKSYVFRDRCQSLSRRLGSLLDLLAALPQKTLAGDVGMLRESAFLLQNELEDTDRKSVV